MDSFASLERRSTADDVTRVLSALTNEIEDLDIMTQDWAYWDDTYKFVQDHNQTYIDLNPTDQTMTYARLNLIAIINKSGEIVFIKTFDTESQESIPIWQSIKEQLAGSILINYEDLDSGTSGIVLLPEVPLMLSARPILTSMGEGPIAGTLIMGRFLDASMIDMLMETVHLPLDIDLIDSDRYKSEFQIAQASLARTQPVFAREINRDFIAGYGLIEDIYGEPALIARIILPREIYAQGNYAVHYFVIALVIVGVVLGILMLILFSRMIMNRMLILDKEISTIASSQDPSLRLTVTGNDELSTFTLKINRMLSSLERSQKIIQERGEQLIRQKELIDRILDTVPVGVMVIDNNSRIITANRTFQDILDIKEIDKDFKPVKEIPKVDDLLKSINRIKKGNEIRTDQEFKYKVNDSDRIFILNVIRMEEDETLIILKDITDERARLERQHLTDRLALVGEMVAGVAHELNNPLTSVIGLSQLLIDEELPDGTKEDIRAIHNETRRAAAIIRNLLTFARKHIPVREPVDINSIIEEVLQLRSYEQKSNNISVKTSFDSSLPEIIADKYQMQQVFLNIILNAEQAMEDAHIKGTLTISTGRINNTLIVSISDNGPGISTENINKLFSPFFTTKEVGKGTGLGLSICYGIVSNHCGKIYALSEPGEGATFIVELPITTDSGTGSQDNSVLPEIQNTL